MRRRELISLIGGAATWSLAARAAEPAPVIGFLHAGSPEPNTKLVAAFRKGLSETGYVEGRNVTIEYRWAEDRDDRTARTGGRSGAPEGCCDSDTRHDASSTRGQGRDHDDSDCLQHRAATRSHSASSPASTGQAATSPGLSIRALDSPGSGSDCCVSWCLGRRALRCLSLDDGPLTQATLKDLQAEAPQLGLPVEILYADTAGEIDAAYDKIG